LKILSRRALTSLSLAATSLLLLLLPADLSNRVRMSVVSPVSPVLRLTSFAAGNTSGFFSAIRKAWSLEKENRQLRRKVASLENQLIQQRDRRILDRQKMANLEVLIKGSVPVGGTILANVLAEDSAHRKSVIIHAGWKDGVRRNAAVLSMNAVVGRIEGVGRSASRVLLLTDPGCRVPARIMAEQSRQSGVVEGAGGELCRMKYVRTSADVRPGDHVLTSGLGGMFPRSLNVGTVVTSAQHRGSLFRKILVRPRVDFRRLETVLVAHRIPFDVPKPRK